MTDPYEQAARWLCEQRDEGADDTLFGVDDDQNDWTRKRWEWTADEIRKHALLNEAVERVKGGSFDQAANAALRRSVSKVKTSGGNVDYDSITPHTVVGSEGCQAEPPPMRITVGQIVEGVTKQALENVKAATEISPWRPIAEAPANRIIELGMIGGNDEDRCFGQFTDKDDGPVFSSDDYMVDGATKEGIADRYRWKDPHPLPKEG